jgi:outer membrane protein assembly factor BamB
MTVPRTTEEPGDPVLTRRAVLAGGAALGLGVAAAQARAAVPRPLRELLREAPASDADWTLPAHDLAATRHAPHAPGLRRRWRAHFPGGVPATAAISGGVVYTASARGAVAALRLRDGHELWRRELGTFGYGSGEGERRLGFFSGVALTDDAVIVASEVVYRLDRRTGATVWKSAPLRTKESDDYFWGPPVVVGGRVLVGSGSGGELPTARGRLSAYDLAGGTLVWSTPTVPLGANGGGIIGPASVDYPADLAFVATGAPYEAVKGSNPGTCSLIAMRLRNGEIVWQDQVFAGDRKGFDFNSAPVIIGRFLVATNKDGIFAWDRRARRRLWHRRITDPLAGGAVAAGPTGGPEGGPIATDGRRIYILSNDAVSGGCVAAALSRDGRVLWRTPLPAPTFAAPALGAGRLHVAGSDGMLRALDGRTGRIVARTALGSPSSAAPAIAAGHLVVGTGAAPYIPGEELVCLG